jgi:hypothetical protein
LISKCCPGFSIKTDGQYLTSVFVGKKRMTVSQPAA